MKEQEILSLLDKFEHYCNFHGLLERTIITYKSIVQQFLSIEDVDITDPEHYVVFLSETMVKSERRSNHYYFAISKFIKGMYYTKDKPMYNKLSKLLPKPPTRDPKKNHYYLSRDLRENIAMNMNKTENQAIGFLQIITGWRIGDILRLKFGDINFELFEEQRILRISTASSKGQKIINAYVGDKSEMEIITSMIDINKRPTVLDEKDEYIFLYKTNSRQEDSNLQKVLHARYMSYWLDFKQALRKLELDDKKYASHDMKRSMARDIWEQYKDINVVQQILNHSRVETTLRYLKHSGISVKEIYLKHQKVI